jgi:hypothetical protein
MDYVAVETTARFLVAHIQQNTSFFSLTTSVNRDTTVHIHRIPHGELQTVELRTAPHEATPLWNA